MQISIYYLANMQLEKVALSTFVVIYGCSCVVTHDFRGRILSKDIKYIYDSKIDLIKIVIKFRGINLHKRAFLDYSLGHKVWFT